MEDFVYTSVHIKTLKKYGSSKLLFLLLGCLVLLLQSLAWILVWVRDMPSTTTDKVFVAVTILGSFMFISTQMFFFNRNRNMINIIKQQGSLIMKRTRIRFSNKNSLGGGIVVFYKVLAVIITVLLGISIVAFIQNYVNWGKIILKMPFIVYCAVGALNRTADIRFQIAIEKSSQF